MSADIEHSEISVYRNAENRERLKLRRFDTPSALSDRSFLRLNNRNVETRNPPITHHSSLITHHPSLITHHSSLITHHSSPITHHPSLITHHQKLTANG
ncbi:MAG: hypothetical protein PHP31_02395 [Lentimicrobiaceae bacterium]|nr:hypothetical protein [Lentimicrobiaceae bacterium]